MTMIRDVVDEQHCCTHFLNTKSHQRLTPLPCLAMALLGKIRDAGRSTAGLLICRRCGRQLTRMNSH
ncbi:MAG TPA: hypothetical protein ENJ18_00380 [Nannocystis exedens]|nr:hypothetical protein [Nannocystis exedens]